MLPNIDDGARSLDMALAMARLAVADGITQTACTPHIYPGLFENTHEGIREACTRFQSELDSAGIPLKLTYGADIQVVPELLESLGNGTLPTLNGSRYFLFEPPHHVALPRLADLVHNTLLSGYVPIITHPERLAYVEADYDKFVDLARQGAWLQLTGGSLLGCFGPRVKQITERFLGDGVTHLLASDGHNLKNRTPELSEARDAAAAIVGEQAASQLVNERPAAVMANADPADVPLPWGLDPTASPPDMPLRGGANKSWFSRLFNAGGQV